MISRRNVLLKLAFCLGRRRRFPKKHVFLSEDEYHRQGEEETRRALEELRKHVRSPDCNAWKTISRLGSPRRCVFAHALHSFIGPVRFDASGLSSEPKWLTSPCLGERAKSRDFASGQLGS